jgi:hypothetical protein
VIVWAATALVLYAYVGYPLLLKLLPPRRHPAPPPRHGHPPISITIPVHNGAATIGAVVESLLAAPYPGERQILVVSDGSTDATVAIVGRYADRGVELLALPTRIGKTEAENLAFDHLRGEIVVNTDASVRLDPMALLELVDAMADPMVGVASGRDVSVDPLQARNEGENAYVDREMALRDLETRAGGIVGASGCLYAVRAAVHRRRLPGHLARDFTSVLTARMAGLRAVSVPSARCFVPRSSPGMGEYRRKVRTMARGLATLGHHWRLLDPFRYGCFAWMLASHKLARWLTPFALVAIAIAMAAPGSGSPAGRVVAVIGLAGAALGWWWPNGAPPRPLAILAYGAAAVLAGIEAWMRALTGRSAAVWEPTRRVATPPPDARA